MKLDTKSFLIGFTIGVAIATVTSMVLEVMERRRIALLMEQDQKDVACGYEGEGEKTQFVCRWETKTVGELTGGKAR